MRVYNQGVLIRSLTAKTQEGARTMGYVSGIIDTLRYALVHKRVSAMAPADQRKVGFSVYEIIYNDFASKVGDGIATCTVRFACPYAAHVRFHCLDELERRKGDANDVLVDYVAKENGDDWEVSVMVATSEKHPYLVADACAMSAVLRIPTATGEYDRKAVTLAGAVSSDPISELLAIRS